MSINQTFYCIFRSTQYCNLKNDWLKLHTILTGVKFCFSFLKASCISLTVLQNDMIINNENPAHNAKYYRELTGSLSVDMLSICA